MHGLLRSPPWGGKRKREAPRANFDERGSKFALTFFLRPRPTAVLLRGDETVIRLRRMPSPPKKGHSPPKNDFLGRERPPGPGIPRIPSGPRASWCHPNSRRRALRRASFGLLVRGGCRGRLRPRSAAVLPPGRTGRSQRCAPLWGSGSGILLRLLRGYFVIVCVFSQIVKRGEVVCMPCRERPLRRSVSGLFRPAAGERTSTGSGRKALRCFAIRVSFFAPAAVFLPWAFPVCAGPRFAQPPKGRRPLDPRGLLKKAGENFILAPYAMGRLDGFTMYRQSRSPRARPSTSISAVAMLLANGMLFWSHSREM